MELALLNTTVITAPGRYDIRTITLDEARQIAASYGTRVRSYIGHPTTARLVSRALGVHAPVDGGLFTQAPQQVALACKLNGRPPTGAELTEEDLERIGYGWWLLERLS